MADTRPRAILFDIGGVVVKSPMRSILTYELGRKIPPGWVNYSISQTSPSGAWHRLERGDIALDSSFFAQFQQDLTRLDLWRSFLKTQRERVEDIPDAAKRDERREMLASMDQDKVPQLDAEWLFWDMMRISRTKDEDMWHAIQALRSTGKFVIGALSNTVKFPKDHEWHVPDEVVRGATSKAATSDSGVGSTKAEMTGRDDLHAAFDVFVSSAHVGLRKPDPRIYRLALDRLAEKTGGLNPEQVIFLDDIGANLKPAKKLGFRTIKVELEKTAKAVKVLQEWTGEDLSAGRGSKL